MSDLPFKQTRRRPTAKARLCSRRLGAFWASRWP